MSQPSMLIACGALAFLAAIQPTNADTGRGVFPVTMQFSSVPEGKGWTGLDAPLTQEAINATLDNMIEHGVTGLYCPVSVYPPNKITPEDAKRVEEAAQARGLFITYQTGGIEQFVRNSPPVISLYSPAYAEAVKKSVETGLAPLKNYKGVYDVFCYQDEPFHQGVKSIGYSDEEKAEFKKRYGYDLPPDLDSIRGNPKLWLDVINFRSDYFRDGWRQVYKIIKETNPGFKVIMTHDSHSTMGAAVNSDAGINVDDVFHWGGDFADTFVYDIYPYLFLDYRYGECGKLVKPRYSQFHYSFGQMRNVCRAYDKELGFWFGTYKAAWFGDFMGSEAKVKWWAEREAATTAVAQGADFLCSGYEIPEDAKHWESLGEGLRLIQKAGKGLLDAPKVKAKACFLFPRTQYIQLQEEYWNVGLSYELFLRAFGELDILHEEQIKDDTLDGYDILCLFDVKLLPKEQAERIASFVRKGGIVIADCAPQLDAYKEPMDVMNTLFGVQDASTARINRTGQWIPYTKNPAMWGQPQDPNASETPTKETVKGKALGSTFDMTIVSPRPCKVMAGETLLSTASGQPALVRRKVGRGSVFLLGFCMQDSYFQTYKDNDRSTRDQLQALLKAITDSAGVRPHVYSSNPDIEASIRANSKEGYLFVIDHEAENSQTTVRLADLRFTIGRIVDVGTGKEIEFKADDGAAELQLTIPQGGTTILRVLPR